MKLFLLLAFSVFSSGSDQVDCPPAKPFFRQIHDLAEFNKIIRARYQINALPLDPKLISFEAIKKPLPCPEPFLATFEKETSLGKKSLGFLAVKHIQPPVIIAETELDIIEKAMKRFMPSQVLVEIPGRRGTITPSVGAESALRCRGQGVYDCPESWFAVETASKLDVNAYSGEPSPKLLYQALSKKFYMNDVYAFASTRAIHTLEIKQIPKDQWPTEFLKIIREEISEDHGAWSYQDYQRWITENFGSKAKIMDSNVSWIDPRNDSKATRLQKISYLADRVRDPYILKQTENLLNQSERPMVVYGSGHFLKQQKALEAALGPASIKCLK